MGFLSAASAPARELRVADTHPQAYPTVQALEHMGRLLDERSNGRLTLKIFHSRVLGEEVETIQQTLAGALEMTRVNLTPLNATIPETIVASLPFLFTSAAHMHRVVDGPVGAEIGRAFEAHGFVLLAYYDSGARSFYTHDKPIQRPADLKGLRIRVQQSPLAEAMVAALGARPTPLAYGQVAVALKTRLIDGAENNLPSYHDAGHYLAAGHYALTEHVMAPEVLMMSKRVWDQLPAADRALIRQAAADSVPEMRRLWAEREKIAARALADAGIVPVAVDKAPFQAAMRPVYDRFAATPALKDLVRRIQATR
ncbi:MAG: TRAP transporter substrate-binding protein [Alphaproteobacteria bacterium]|nr:TRAP transporter substrate-binding protein [Alphaproteobacteria bacterium]